MPSPTGLIAVVSALLAVAGSAYHVLTIVAARRFRSEPRKADAGFTPPVSILKSLKGIDPHMYAAFRSHCVQDYPGYELLFGVSDSGDPAVALVDKLRTEFPARAIRTLFCPKVLGANGKVSTLAQMLPQARYEHIVINDSDILVGPDYLARVFAPLAASEVGMVTALYRGAPGNTWASRLEALGIAPEFAGSVLLARQLEGGVKFALGGTIATTKSVLKKIGGLEGIVDYLADDYELGARTAAAGYRVEIADTVIETAVPDYSFADFWSHQLRWARTVKDRRPSHYLGIVVTFAIPWAVLAVALHPRWWTWAVLGAAACARFASAWFVSSRVMSDRVAIRNLWLLPLRDFASLAVWVASFLGNAVEWRGMRFRLRQGKLERV
jgi:ceramide glucosyltransferase